MSRTNVFNIGSTNKGKIEALEELLKEYSTFQGYSVTGMNVTTGVSDQPLSMEETIEGAVNRAKNSFVNCDYSIGLESGLMKVPQTKSGYLEFCACVFFDGKNIHLGLFSAWEPNDPKIIASMISERLDLAQAANKANITSNRSIGSEIGVMGVISKGKFVRKSQTKEAIRTAIIHVQ